MVSLGVSKVNHSRWSTVLSAIPEVMASMKTGLDNSAAAQAVKIAIAPTMGYARRLGSTADEFPVSFAVYGRI